jgi:hypothetical protein
MASMNRLPENEKQNFQQIEKDSCSAIYLPAICAGVVMTIVLLMAVSCSKKSDNTSAKINAPAVPAIQNSASGTNAANVPEPPKKAIKKHHRTHATFVNGTYGVSFTYPLKYSLQAGSKHTELPVEPGFTKTGAVEIASVDMPEGLYSDTDYSSALLNLSVNQGLSAEECGHFSNVPGDTAAKKAADPAAGSTDTPKLNTVKLGANAFSTVEQMKGSEAQQSDVKYFHLFKNGACYEFALEIETSRKVDEELAQVDRSKVFQQLEKILTTAKIKEVELPGLENAEKAPVAPVTTTESKTVASEKAQVVAPGEQK